VGQSEHNYGIHPYVRDVRFYRNRAAQIEPVGAYMQNYACVLGATLATGIQAHQSSKFEERDSYLQLADQITKTCRDASNCTRSGLAPNKFYFDMEDEATNSKNAEDAFETGNYLK
jgi:hypothetical protein